jgi:hypothetical protein
MSAQQQGEAALAMDKAAIRSAELNLVPIRLTHTPTYVEGSRAWAKAESGGLRA